MTSKEREGSRGPAAAQDAGNGASGDGRVGGKDVVRGRGSVGDNDRSRSASGRPRSTGGGGSPSREPAAKRSRASSPPEAASGGRFTTRPWAADIPRRGGSGGTAASFDKGRQGKRGRDREQCALGGGPRRGSPSRGRSQEQQLERSGSRGRGADGEVAVPRESGQPGERLRPGREGAATRTCLARPLSPLPPPRPTPPLRLQSLHVCAVPAGSVADRDYGAHRRQPPPCRAPPPPRPLQSVLSLGGGATPFKPSRLSLPWPIWPTLGGGGRPGPRWALPPKTARRRHWRLARQMPLPSTVCPATTVVTLARRPRRQRRGRRWVLPTAAATVTPYKGRDLGGCTAKLAASVAAPAAAAAAPLGVAWPWRATTAATAAAEQRSRRAAAAWRFPPSPPSVGYRPRRGGPCRPSLPPWWRPARGRGRRGWAPTGWSGCCPTSAASPRSAATHSTRGWRGGWRDGPRRRFPSGLLYWVGYTPSRTRLHLVPCPLPPPPPLPAPALSLCFFSLPIRGKLCGAGSGQLRQGRRSVGG